MKENTLKVAYHTLGCKVNQYETEAIKASFEKNQYESIGFFEKADIYIINTCTVTNIADKKSRQMIKKAKKNNPEALVVAVGCYAQKKNDDVLDELGIDLVLGNTKKNQVLPIVETYLKDHKKRYLVEEISDVDTFETMWLSDTSDKTRVYLKIQDGCNQFCAYCIIPYVRGRIRSRSYDNIVDEVKGLVANGYKEVVLTGIHLASYLYDGKVLIDLIRGLNEVDGLKRIRLGSLEPTLITEAFVSQMTSLKKVCPHFHLSLQSGCDRTLKAMNRKYTTEDYAHAVGLLRKHYDKPAITTDVIVGFPDERDEDFEITRAFVKSIMFSDIHVFKYSIREGTQAAKMSSQIDGTVKDLRSKALIELGHTMSKEYLEAYVNESVLVLWEETIHIDGLAYVKGHTDTYMTVYLQVSSDIDNLVNTISRVTLIKAFEQGLLSEVTDN